MSVTVASFRGAFPAFASTAIYPDAQVQMYLDMSLQLQDVNRWGTMMDYGTQLFTAHNLTLDYPSNKVGALGQKPGEIEGPVTNGSVDKVSYGRNPQAALNPKDGHWNLTSFGIRYVRLIMMFGAGPQHVGIPLGGSDPNWFPQAWPGPNLGPY